MHAVQTNDKVGHVHTELPNSANKQPNKPTLKLPQLLSRTCVEDGTDTKGSCTLTKVVRAASFSPPLDGKFAPFHSLTLQ